VQVRAALANLAGGTSTTEGGDLVVRVGDCYTRFTASLLHILARSFNHIRIVKPYLSSPLDAEKFVVCTGFAGELHGVSAILDQAIDACEQGRSVMAFVPMSCLLQPTFMRWINVNNDRLGRRQLAAFAFAAGAAATPVAIADKDFVALGEEAVQRISLPVFARGPGGD